MLTLDSPVDICQILWGSDILCPNHRLRIWNVSLSSYHSNSQIADLAIDSGQQQLL
jgi:hypothetical protein